MLQPLGKLPRWLSLGLALPLICLNGWLLLLLAQSLQPLTNTFITAALAAFLLDYPIWFLEQRGVGRVWAVGLVLISAILLLSITILGLGPSVVDQLIELAARLPAWIDQGQQQIQSLDDWLATQPLPIDLDRLHLDLSELTTQLTNQISLGVRSLSKRALNLTLDTIDSVANLFITVVLTIFLVLNGTQLWEGLLSWLPTPWKAQVQTSLKQSFQNYFAGQATLAVILSVIMITAFVVMQVPFGLLFGVVIGLASLIPFGGVLTITVVSGLLAFQDIWLGVKVLVVAILLGQINDNIVAPRLLGGITGLNPAWLFMSLLVGAKFGGFLGLLVAVPTASFVKATIDDWRNGTLGEDGKAIAPPKTPVSEITELES